MKLIRFSDTQHHVDQNGTLSIIVGKDIVLKISPLDSLVSCLEQVKILLPADRIEIAEDIINRVLTVMNIPQDISDKVSEGFHEDEKKENLILTMNDVNNKMPESKSEEVLSDIENSWLSYVKRFVNEKYPICIFDSDEIDNILEGECIDKFVNFVEKRYLIENNENSIKISIKKA